MIELHLTDDKFKNTEIGYVCPPLYCFIDQDPYNEKKLDKHFIIAGNPRYLVIPKYDAPVNTETLDSFIVFGSQRLSPKL